MPYLYSLQQHRQQEQRQNRRRHGDIVSHNGDVSLLEMLEQEGHNVDFIFESQTRSLSSIFVKSTEKKQEAFFSLNVCMQYYNNFSATNDWTYANTHTHTHTDTQRKKTINRRDEFAIEPAAEATKVFWEYHQRGFQEEHKDNENSKAQSKDTENKDQVFPTDELVYASLLTKDETKNRVPQPRCFRHISLSLSLSLYLSIYLSFYHFFDCVTLILLKKKKQPSPKTKNKKQKTKKQERARKPSEKDGWSFLGCLCFVYFRFLLCEQHCWANAIKRNICIQFSI